MYVGIDAYAHQCLSTATMNRATKAITKPNKDIE